MRVIVCGGRSYADKERVWGVLNKIHATTQIDEIVHGGAAGADYLAKLWARMHFGVTETEFRADWKRDGKAAGPKRNEIMAKYGAELCVAFPGGSGTADMVRRAERRNIPIQKVDWNV